MKLFTILLLIVTGTSSCYHLYYAPNTPNAPLLSQKGETRINGLYCGGGSSEFEGGELQAATAVSKNIAVMANAMFIGKKEMVSDFSGNSHEESGKGSYIELAAGTFKTFGLKNKWVSEIYGGAGFGTANNVYSNNLSSTVNTHKLFIQSGIGYKSKYFECAFVPKLSFVNLHTKRDDLAGIGESEYNFGDEQDLQNMAQHSSHIIFEPAIILRGGGENVKIQAGLSYSCNNQIVNNYGVPMAASNLSIGISINLAPAKKH